MQPVAQGIDAEFKGMAGAEKIVEMRLEIKLVDIESEFVGVDGIVGGGNIILIPVIPRSHQAVKLVIENMLPFEGDIAVAIAIGCVVIEVEPVLAQIARKIDAIGLTDLMADIEVDVVKRSPAVFVLIGQLSQQPVGVGGPAAQDKGGLVLCQRSFNVKTAG